VCVDELTQFALALHKFFRFCCTFYFTLYFTLLLLFYTFYNDENSFRLSINNGQTLCDLWKRWRCSWSFSTQVFIISFYAYKIKWFYYIAIIKLSHSLLDLPKMPHVDVCGCNLSRTTVVQLAVTQNCVQGTSILTLTSSKAYEYAVWLAQLCRQ